ncbi:MAG: hypothetical protein APR54_11490, partial [Candidatus Cloacimonas sp. SDB]
IFPLSAKKKPDWVKQRPIDHEYYIGIGVARKTADNKDYIQTAKNDALKNLAAEIEVTISSEVFSSVIEKSGILEDELRAEIVSTTQAELEDYKLIDTWENKEEYWIYYRLARDTYKLNRMKKIDKASALSLDLFRKARQSRQDQDYTKALTFYLQALKPLEPYISEPLLTEFEGREIYLNNEIYFELQDFMASLKIYPTKSPLSAKTGKPLQDKAAGFTCMYSAVESDWLVKDMPLIFEFIRGEGEMVESSRTDSKGLSRLIISRINSPEKMQIVKASVDLNVLVEADTASFLFTNIINSLPLPEGRIIINVSGLSVFMETYESNLGKAENIRYAEPELKQELAELGYTFTEDIAAADLYIQLKAETSEGSYMYEMYSVYADANISVTDMSSGEEIYKTSLSKVKGIDLDKVKAGRKALDKVGRELADEVVSKLKDKL